MSNKLKPGDNSVVVYGVLRGGKFIKRYAPGAWRVGDTFRDVNNNHKMFILPGGIAAVTSVSPLSREIDRADDPIMEHWVIPHENFQDLARAMDLLEGVPIFYRRQRMRIKYTDEQKHEFRKHYPGNMPWGVFLDNFTLANFYHMHHDHEALMKARLCMNGDWHNPVLSDYTGRDYANDLENIMKKQNINIEAAIRGFEG